MASSRKRFRGIQIRGGVVTVLKGYTVKKLPGNQVLISQSTAAAAKKGPGVAVECSCTGSGACRVVFSRGRGIECRSSANKPCTGHCLMVVTEIGEPTTSGSV